MHKLISFLIIGIIFSTYTYSQAQDCGQLTPSLVIGQEGRVTPGAPNNIRPQPDGSRSSLGIINGGEMFRVLEGPQCINGYAWWRVSNGHITGWTPEYKLDSTEYWLEPIINGVLVQHPHDDSVNNSFRDISFTWGGGGGGYGCYVRWDEIYLDFDNVVTIDQTTEYWSGIEFFIDDRDPIFFSRVNVLNATIISPSGYSIALDVDQYFEWSEEEQCIGSWPSNSISSAFIPMQAFFNPGTWEIQLTTVNGTIKGNVEVDAGSKPVIGNKSDIVYMLNLRPYEDLQVLFFKYDDSDQSYHYWSTRHIKADSEGRLAFFKQRTGSNAVAGVVFAKSTGQIFNITNLSNDQLTEAMR